MNISPTTLAIITTASTLFGVLLSSIFSLLNTRLNKKYEAQKQLQQLAVTAAIEEWKKLMETAGEMSKARKQTIEVGQLATFILKNSKIIEMCSDPQTNKENIKKRLMDIDETVNTAIHLINENTQRDGQSQNHI